MRYCGMFEGASIQITDTTVINYINELKTNYEHQIHKLKNKAILFENKYLEIKERYDLLIYKRFMRSAEQFTDNKQQQLFTPEAEAVEDVPSEDEKESTANSEVTEVKSYTRNKPGRKPINPDIPREEKIIDIPEEDKKCACGADLAKIGEETNEKLHIIAPRIYVVKTIRPKYACRHCEGVEEEGEKPTVKIAPIEPTIIPRSIASPSLLSTVFIGKFEDHNPYYRQEKQFERIGVEISRQDMSNWQQLVYKALLPLVLIIKNLIKSGPFIQMDETSVQVMSNYKLNEEKPEEKKTRNIETAWMWLARGGPPDQKVIWYEYHESRGGKHAKEILEGYSGYLQTDGYEAYDSAVKDNPQIIHVGCFAHARRKFFEASKASKNNKSAEEGIKHIRKLYMLEDKLRSEKLTDEEFVKKRKKEAAPILEEFKSWLLKRANEVPPENLMGKAINYSLRQWDKMTAYLESCHLTPDNNACERAIRPFVIGRKNWLMAGSPEGAKSSCAIYSLIETAKQNDIIPAHYLTALFEKAPYAKSSEDWEKLLPWNIFRND